MVSEKSGRVLLFGSRKEVLEAISEVSENPSPSLSVVDSRPHFFDK